MWVFFDVGGTLFDEEPFISLLFKELHEMLLEYGVKVHFNDLYEKVEEIVLNRKYEDHFFINVIENTCLHFGRDKEMAASIIRRYKSELAPQYLDKIRPYPGVEIVLERMSRKYKLGIIANQSLKIREYLEEKWKLSHYFKLIVISEEVGYRKPNLNIFLHALGEANSSPSNAFMIGDRLDYDIKPAKILGMGTIRVKQGIFSVQKPETTIEIPDFEVSCIKDLLNLFR